MTIWKNRTPEIAYLLNPAFCSAIIYATIFEYQKKAKNCFPYTLIYLILPMILHKSTRERISSRTNMVVWLQKNSDVLIGYPARASSLIPFTNEALEFLLEQMIINIDDGKLSILKTIPKSKMSNFTDQEILECIQKAEHVGRWFAQMGAEENIYAAWGVKP